LPTREPSELQRRDSAQRGKDGLRDSDCLPTGSRRYSRFGNLRHENRQACRKGHQINDPHAAGI